jgi:hypothetical protein
MKIRTIVLGLVLAATALLAGCGNRQVLLSVDALSFTAPQDRVLDFGPVPPLPVPVATGEVPVFDDLHVNLLDGTKDVVDVQDVTLTFSADLTDSTGSGLDTLRVYMSDRQTDPVTTMPIMTAPLALVPGQHSPVHVVVSGDPRLNALFAQQELRVTVTTSFAGPASGQALNGRLAITELRAAIVARHHSSL